MELGWDEFTWKKSESAEFSKRLNLFKIINLSGESYVCGVDCELKWKTTWLREAFKNPSYGKIPLMGWGGTPLFR